MEPSINQIAYFVPILTAITAIILLVAGGRLLKPAIGLCGGLLGFGSGLLLAPSLSISVSPLVIALICGVFAAIVAVFISKFAILLILGISCAIIAPVITWHVAGLGDGALVVEEIIAAATAPPVEQDASAQVSLPTSQDDVSRMILDMVTDASKITRSGKERANAAWNVIQYGSRMMLVGSALVGLLIGLLIATFTPFFAAAIVTSLLGSILLVESIRSGITIIWSQHSLSDASPTMLLIATFCIALAGLGLQMTLFRKRSAHPQPE